MPRRKDPWDEAEAAFRPARPARAPDPTPAPGGIPQAKEAVTLRVDADVLAFFQQDGPGWQDRMLEVLRKGAGL